MNKKAYINGEFIESENRLEITSPITLETYGSVPSLQKEQIDTAFKAARNSFKGWKALTIEERKKHIEKFNELLLENKDSIAEIMHMEIGKPVKESIVEIERTNEYIKETIQVWETINTKTVEIGNKTSIQKRIPLGVVLAISPFNYPVNLSLAKIAPALLAGNSVVFKAATNGSITGAALAELFDKAGIPAGVFNYVSGRGRDIGDILTAHEEIDMITFTGGERVGKGIAQSVHMKPLVLELGGNDAAYVRHDANIQKAIKEVVAGAFGFAGQRCTAIKRVILHENIADEVIEGITELTKELEIVPLITEGAANYVKSLYDESMANGAELILGGHFNKNHVDATIIKTTDKDKAWTEEAFGPLLPILVVNNDDDAIRIMNDTRYGLQNSIFTEDMEWVDKIAPTIESGSININAKSSRGPDIFPFSGVKDSGFGTQGIAPALESMTRIINIVKNK